MVGLNMIWAAVGLLFLAVISEATQGCNLDEHGIPCCEMNFTPGDNNNGNKEEFIQAHEYKTNCIESCKMLHPESTGVTESVSEKYTSGAPLVYSRHGEGMGKNKCWCEFGAANLDAENTNYRTCMFAIPSPLAMVKSEPEPEYYNIEGLRCTDECKLDERAQLFTCNPVKPVNGTANPYCSPNSMTTYRNEVCVEKCSATRTKFFKCKIVRESGSTTDMPCSPQPDP